MKINNYKEQRQLRMITLNEAIELSFTLALQFCVLEYEIGVLIFEQTITLE